jgi:hypothetical protein
MLASASGAGGGENGGGGGGGGGASGGEVNGGGDGRGGESSGGAAAAAPYAAACGGVAVRGAGAALAAAAARDASQVRRRASGRGCTRAGSAARPRGAHPCPFASPFRAPPALASALDLRPPLAGRRPRRARAAGGLAVHRGRPGDLIWAHSFSLSFPRFPQSWRASGGTCHTTRGPTNWWTGGRRPSTRRGGARASRPLAAPRPPTRPRPRAAARRPARPCFCSNTRGRRPAPPTGRVLNSTQNPGAPRPQNRRPRTSCRGARGSPCRRRRTSTFCCRSCAPRFSSPKARGF